MVSKNLNYKTLFALALSVMMVFTMGCSSSQGPGTGQENDHMWVDLGLPSGLKWATCNIGASRASDYGDYFAWGEVDNAQSKSDLREYQFYQSRRDRTLLKYNTDSEEGTVDNITRLELSDDAARKNWGGRWRMPTKADFEELIAKCKFEWVTQDGVPGYRVTSKKWGNKMSIFLPAAGACSDVFDDDYQSVGSEGFYWSSDLDESFPTGANNLYFSSDPDFTEVLTKNRFIYLPIRPVVELD